MISLAIVLQSLLFVAGLRSKYGLNDSTSAQVIEQALRGQPTHAAEDLYADANKLLAVRAEQPGEQQQDLTQSMAQQGQSMPPFSPHGPTCK